MILAEIKRIKRLDLYQRYRAKDATIEILADRWPCVIDHAPRPAVTQRLDQGFVVRQCRVHQCEIDARPIRQVEAVEQPGRDVVIQWPARGSGRVSRRWQTRFE